MSLRASTGLVAALLVALATPVARAQTTSVPPFLAGTPTFGSTLQEIDVAPAPDGGFLLVWMEFGSELGEDNRIVSRRFSRSGVALTPPTRIDTSGYGLYPVVVANDSGGFVAGWEWMKPGGGHAYFTRRLDGDGRGFAAEIRVDKRDYGPVVSKSLAWLPTGPVYFWKQNGFWQRRYDSTLEDLSEAIFVASNAPAFENSMAAMPDGGFVVAWTNRWLSSQSWGRLYDADGNARGNQFVIDAAGLVDSVAVSPDGEIAAVGHGGAGNGDVWLRRFSSSGVPLGARQTVRTLPESFSAPADAAYDSFGNLFVVWREYDLDTNTAYPARARAYDAGGEALGADFPLDERTAIEVRTAALADDCFATGWYSGARTYATVTCLCSAAASTCGNGTLEPTCEKCDDGNRENGDGCDANCMPSACGNGMVSDDEECDDGNLSSGDGCDANCTQSRCGNGIRAGAEQCDDGNLKNGDGCDADCTITGCGNGVVTEGEACDDGNRQSGDGCDENCTPSACGNGIRAGKETCDDGNLKNGDGCDENCTATACGNAVRTSGEECDDGNVASGDGCDKNCLVEECGNERREASEECDDGNRESGDGCEADCTLTAVHDSVLLPIDPIDLKLPKGKETATYNVILQVTNADVFPERENPGHLMIVTASDGDCPEGTVSAQPDFERGKEGAQNSVRVVGGVRATAIADVTISREKFRSFDKRVPTRCTLWFKVTGEEGAGIDPTPDNNSIGVELNVGESVDVRHEFEDEFYLESIKPTTVKIPNGQDVVTQQIKPMVRRAKDFSGIDEVEVVVVAGDGDCPAGTVGFADFDKKRSGHQNTLRLRRGKRAKGSLALIVKADAFDSPSDDSPRRCTAVLSIAGEDDSDASNNTTRLVVDVIDRNDF